MVAYASQNGYSAGVTGLIASYDVPGGKLAMRKGDVSTVLQYVATRFHHEVEALIWPGNWGYAFRANVNSPSSLSNHSSGTAIDLNAPLHPNGVRGTFTATKIRAVRAILDDCDGVIRWGEDYSRTVDGMHFEINAGATAVAAVAARIRGGSTITSEEDDMTPEQAADLSRVRQVLEALDLERARLKEAADRIMGAIPDRRYDSGEPMQVALGADVAYAVQLINAEGDVDRNQLAEWIVLHGGGSAGATVDTAVLAATLSKTLGASVAAELGKKLVG